MSKARVLLQVDERFFGDVKGDTLELHTGDRWDCDYYPFQIGERYVVYAHRDKTKQLRTGRCDGTKPISKADKDLDYLRTPANHRRIYGSILGVLFDPSSGLYADSLLKQMPIRLTAEGMNRVISTDEVGDFEFRGLKAGEYRLQASLPSYYGINDPEPNGGFVRNIKLNALGCSEESFVAVVKNSLEGTVIDEQGKPMEGVEVSLVPGTALVKDHSSNNTYTVESDQNGRFRFDHVFPRRYVLGINIAPRGEDDEEMDVTNAVYYPGTPDRDKAQLIDFGLGQSLSGFRLQPAK